MSRSVMESPTPVERVEIESLAPEGPEVAPPPAPFAHAPSEGGEDLDAYAQDLAARMLADPELAAQVNAYTYAYLRELLVMIRGGLGVFEQMAEAVESGGGIGALARLLGGGRRRRRGEPEEPEDA